MRIPFLAEKKTTPTWTFWSEKEFTDVYENIYVRTLAEDWFSIVSAVAKQLEGAKEILDIGCGEGHTTKQILDRVSTPHTCDLLEPNGAALTSAVTFLKKENVIGKGYPTTLKDFVPEKKYDAVFTSHTNYYWGETEEEYRAQLAKFASLAKAGGVALLLGLPKESDHYAVLVEDIYPDYVRTEYAVAFLKAAGYAVSTEQFTMRLYVGDLFTTRSTFDLRNFYRFMHGVEVIKEEKLVEFLDRIRATAKDGYLSFKDQLVIVRMPTTTI